LYAKTPVSENKPESSNKFKLWNSDGNNHFILLPWTPILVEKHGYISAIKPVEVGFPTSKSTQNTN
jgi:hypothetical protein